MKDKHCGKCEHKQECAYDCVAFKPSTEQTNEEWFCQLSTEEKARLLVSNKLFFRMLDYDGFIEWLKEKYK